MSRFPTGPTGRVEADGPVRRLVIERSFQAPVEDVWADFADPERLARWYGTIVGTPGPGATLTVLMTAEEEPVPEPVRILSCDPPHGFALELGDEEAPWPVSVSLAEVDGTTTMTFVHTLTDGVDGPGVGPGWELYADRLTALRLGDAMPDWEADRYQEVLGPHYGATG